MNVGKMKLNFQQANNRFEILSKNGFALNNLKEEDESVLSEKIRQIFSDLKSKERFGYSFDERLSCKFHSLLKNNDWMKPYLESSYDFWRYFALNIMPREIYERFKGKDNEEGETKESIKSHFFSKPVRIYPFDLYWYYEIMNCGDEEKTLEFMNNDAFSSDTIVALVERTGPLSFRKDLFHEIAVKVADPSLKEKIKNKFGNRKDNFLRTVMVENSLKFLIYQPDLYDGGVEGYVSDLIRNVLGD